MFDFYIMYYPFPLLEFITWQQMKWSESRSVVSSSLWHHRLYSPWNSLGQNTGVGSCSLLQELFPTQGLNPGLLHCRQILSQLSYQGSPMSGKVWQTDVAKRVFFSFSPSVIQFCFFLIGGTVFNIITKQCLYFSVLYNISMLLYIYYLAVFYRK